MPQVFHGCRVDLGVNSEAAAGRIATLSWSEQRAGKLRGQMSNLGLQPAITDRRVSTRLPIEREVRYKVLGVRKTVGYTGSGKTLNMSSGGVLFTTESDLPEGARVEIAVSWPAQLDDSTPLKLVAIGVLVRSDERQAAISIKSYEFRTRGLSL
jgi:hypothetical protein